VAQGNVEPHAPILKTVAYDLDVLQELSITLAELAEYVSDVAPTAGPYWMEAASTVSVKQQLKQLAGASGGQIALNISDSVKFIQRPPNEQELKVGGSWQLQQQVVLLCYCVGCVWSAWGACCVLCAVCGEMHVCHDADVHDALLISLVQAPARSLLTLAWCTVSMWPASVA
jgi:hypothetical protein